MPDEQEAAIKLERVGANERDKALDALRRDGVVVVDNAFASDRIVQFREHLRELYPSYFGIGAPPDFFEVGERRFTAPVCFAPPLDCADIVLEPPLSDLLAGILTDEFVIEALGVISSLPGAPAQSLHRDGGILFPESDFDRLLPTTAVAVSIPLVDMNDVSGTTAFWPGSHRVRSAADAPFAAPEVPVGSMVLWDYRILHRGMANRGSEVRPILYLSVCRPFWIDHANYKPRKNTKLMTTQAALDALNKKGRARLARAELVAGHPTPAK